MSSEAIAPCDDPLCPLCRDGISISNGRCENIQELWIMQSTDPIRIRNVVPE